MSLPGWVRLFVSQQAEQLSAHVRSTMRTVPGKMAGRENIRHVVLHPEQLDTEYHSKLAEAGWPVSGPSDLVTARCSLLRPSLPLCVRLPLSPYTVKTGNLQSRRSITWDGS